MWTHAVYGTDLYHFIQWFILYSFMGWVVESIYMSFCNRKLTNRGFAFSPFCPIYAVGALSVYGMLRPLEGQYVVLYLACYNAGIYYGSAYAKSVWTGLVGLYGETF